MTTDSTSSSHFAKRALAHARVIGATPRGSATEAERQAAQYVQEQCKSLAIANVQLEPFQGLRSLWLFLALAFGLALVGHAAFWLLRGTAGDYPALLIAVLAFVLSGFLIWRKFSFHDYPLRLSLPHAPSQNVVAVIPPVSDIRQRVVLVGHLDSHRAVFWFATNLLVVIFGIISIITMYGIYFAIPVYILAALTKIQLFAWLGLVLAAFHFLAWFTGVTADLGRYSPGANDNASGIGTALALAERLIAEPLQHTEVWLAFTGCEESGCDGMLSLIKAHGETLKEALFLDFEMVGIGDGLCYTSEEGNLHRQRISPEVEALLKEVGMPFDLHSVKGPLVGAFSEGGTLWEYGFKAACLSAHYRNSPFLAEWHRLSDTPSRLQVESFERIHALSWALLHRVDRQLA
jgi:Peptidase family M28